MDFRVALPYTAMILLQFGYAGLTIIAKFALNKGMSTYTLVVYRHALAYLIITPFALRFERNARARLTIPIFLQILALALLEPVLDQNLLYMGMKYTTASFAAALSNVTPAMTFVMAWIFRLEKMNLRELRSITKLLGTGVSLCGAFVMTLYTGPSLTHRSTSDERHRGSSETGAAHNDLKGRILLITACSCVSVFVIIQTITLRRYPCELKLSAMVCLMGAVMATPVALVMERHNMAAAWSLSWDTKLLTIVYAAVVCSGLAYVAQGYLMRQRGPVFVTAFSPLYMIIVAILGMIFLGEDLTMGRVIGAVLIMCGLYMVVWGKSKDEPHAPNVQEDGIEMISGA